MSHNLSARMKLILLSVRECHLLGGGGGLVELKIPRNHGDLGPFQSDMSPVEMTCLAARCQRHDDGSAWVMRGAKLQQ